MKTYTTQEQRNSLQELIQTELLKRGFTAKIISFEEEDKKYLKFHTESFQTVPVLFKEIQVSNFSTSVGQEIRKREDKTEYQVTTFWIQVDVRYSHFEGGSNGSRLFAIQGHFFEDSDRPNVTQLR